MNVLANEKSKGITLIALIITIIVLLILAGITINMLFSNQGPINKTQEAEFKTEVQQIQEILQTTIVSQKITNSNFNQQLLKGNLSTILNDQKLYEKYVDKLLIHRGELIYIGSIEDEKKWAKDIGIKVFDINSEEDKLALNIDGLKSSAIEKNQITKNQYPYRITGDLKTKIEEKLGRNIDYSTDRFYEVKYKNILPEIADGKTFIYSDYSGIAIEVKEQTQRNVATWFWLGSEEKDVAIMEQKATQNDFFEKLESYNISQIYISQKIFKLLENTRFQDFVANAYSRDIKVYIVVGTRNYLDANIRDKSIYSYYDTVEKYNQSVAYNKRIAGISYDAEVWLNSEYNWKTNEATRNAHVKYIQDTKKYAQSKNLEAIFTLPFWLVQYNCTDSNGNTVNMYDEITKTLEEVNLMIYRDTSEKINNLVSNIQNNAEKSLREYSQQNECVLNIGVETGPSSEGNFVTFYEEESETQGYLMGELQKLETLYSSSDWEDFIFSIHHTTILMQFLGGLQIANVIQIGTPYELVEFLSRTADGNGVTFELTSDINMKGYTVSAYDNLDNGFSGVFDGKNHTIENLTINSQVITGLFKKVGTNGIVKNLNIKDSTVTTSAYYAGAVAGNNYGTIMNCSNQNTTVTGKQYVGGLVGRNYGTIKNSFNTGNITCLNYYVGGLAGKCESSSVIFNVYSTGTITEKGSDGAKGAITAQNVGTIEKAYWLEGSAPKAIGYKSEGETISMEMDAMKANSFVDILNSNISTNTDLSKWKIDKVGEEYPHF